jgi:hypothetical protein
MGELYGGREAETGRSLKSKRVQESRDRESAEGSKNSRRIVALLLSFFPFFFQVVFSQSQGQGWERGSGGVVGHRRIRGQEGYTRDISISREGW